MADRFQNSSSMSRTRFQTAIWTLKLAFLIIGIVSTFLLLKLAIPYSLNIFLSTLPRLWISFRSWLAPPYLYIVLNFIIISIAASSSYQKKLSEKKMESEEEAETVKSPRRESKLDHRTSSESRSTHFEENETVSVSVSDTDEKALVLVEKFPETWSETSCLTDSDNTPIRKSKPPVSGRSVTRKSTEVTVNRRSDKSSPVPLKHIGFAESKKNDDSLDATWKAITEGQGKPMTKHLRKSDTWDVAPRVVLPEPVTDDTASSRKELRKSETFNDAASTTSSGSGSSGGGGGGGGGGVRFSREKSLSQDELNRRVETFIKKFKNDIKLQRQESYKRYLEMVNRGVY